MSLSNREMTIWLNFHKVDSAVFEKLEMEFPLLSEILDSSADIRLRRCLPSFLYETISKYRSVDLILEELSLLKKGNYEIMTHLDEKYPSSLRVIEKFPRVLYYRGHSEFLNGNLIAVVGARKITEYGKWACKHFVEAFSEYDLTIVSGLAMGTDGLAHKSALSNDMKTIGVLGTGIDKIFPEKNRNIFQQMYSDGLVLTEFPPGTAGVPMNFPIRNRIIAGLSKIVIVVEAKRRSGSLITARLAFEQGKEVFAIPGNINSVYSQGTNELIRDGAIPLLDIKDIVEEFHGLKKIKKEPLETRNDLSETEKKILRCLSDQPKSAETLCDIVGISYSEVCAILTILEIKGYLTELYGGVFSLK